MEIRKLFLGKNQMTIHVGEEEKIAVIITPLEARSEVYWELQDDKVSVSEDGIITEEEFNEKKKNIA